MNEALLIGHLGHDPEIRETQGGRRIARFSLGTTERWRDDQGNRREKTEWHKIVVLADGLVKLAERYLRKGSKVLVRGQIVARKYTDRSNVERTVTEILLKPYVGVLDLHDPPNRARAAGDAGPPVDPAPPEGPPPLDDEMPF